MDGNVRSLVHMDFWFIVSKDHFLFKFYFLKLNIEMKLMSSEARHEDKVIILLVPGGAACPH